MKLIKIIYIVFININIFLNYISIENYYIKFFDNKLYQFDY